MSEEPRYFIGEFEHTIDSVNRLVIPAKWRTGKSEELVMFAREKGRLAVMPKGEFEKILRAIDAESEASLSKRRELYEDLSSSARQVTCDKQGRITMDVELMKHAGLQGKVMLVGGGERFAMWSPKAWTHRQSRRANTKTATMERFGI